MKKRPSRSCRFPIPRGSRDRDARSNRGVSTPPAATRKTVAEKRSDRPSIMFPADLLAEKDLAAARDAMSLQNQLIVSRRSALQAEMNVINESIIGYEAQMRGVEAAKASKEEQIKLLREELKGQRDLASEGYLPRNRVSEQERLMAQLNGAVSEDLANLGRYRSAISELKKIGRAHV